MRRPHPCRRVFSARHEDQVVFSGRTIYADYAATTPLRSEVLEAMLPYLTENFGNPSGYHSYAKAAKNAIEQARENVASALGALQKNEIIFTSGGTESNLLAISGLARISGRGRVLVSPFEHAAVAEPLEVLREDGFEIHELSVDRDGNVSVEQIRNCLTPDTVLVTVMAVNNEVGTIQPIEEIGKILESHPALFHTDAVQAPRAVPVNVAEWGVDALSLSGHKLYGPKGVGALWVRSGIGIHPTMVGGGQERNRRGGTENVPGIVGLAKSLEFLNKEREQEIERMTRLSQRLLKELPQRIDGCEPTGHLSNRHPAIASFILEAVDGPSLLVHLDRLGVAASSGSACSTREAKVSRTLKAMGYCEESSRGSLRLSIGKQTSEQDVELIMDRVERAVALSRALC